MAKLKKKKTAKVVVRKKKKKAVAKKRKAKAVKKKNSAESGKKNKGGRPRIEFNLGEVEKLGVLHCTESDMAAFFNCSRETICDHMVNDEAFSTAFNKGKGNGNISLRRVQFKRALAGNVKLLIWLGKQYLGQKDKIEQTNRDMDLSHLTDDELKEELRGFEQA